ncbi:DNA internalization-related competence protein ComEC/Rec2 [Utexia brackfieldae]|uniref:DNA internalization-related competence protein ComEC/Rec2 n=1 Tax=Utexia brackfieldae TaxID=3074108 RepID=UPI00370D0C5B
MKINQDIAVLAFIVGSSLLLFLPTLITGYLFIGLSLVLFCLFMIQWLYHCHFWLLSFISFSLFGLLWSCFSAQQVLDNARPYADQTVTALAIIKTINIDAARSSQLSSAQPLNQSILLELIQINDRQLNKPIIVKAQWSDPSLVFYAGEVWSLNLRLKAIHSRLNQGGFDSQRWSLSRHLVLSATIQGQTHRISTMLSVRQQVVSFIVEKIAHYSRSGVMLGLLFGERGNMTKHELQQLLHTGIGHLMAISGMHIMLFASAVFYLCKSIQKCLPTRYISLRFPFWLSLIAACFYVWLSGTNPPAQRALTAFLLVLLCRFNGVSLGAWQLWLRVVAVLIFINPLALLSDSFWLSCFAVASLIFLYQWFPLSLRLSNKRLDYFLRLCHLQLGLLLLLLPIQITIFNGISLVSLVTNLIAIPLMSLIILPLLFLSMLLSLLGLDFLSQHIWWLANFTLEMLFLMADKIQGSWLNISHNYRYISLIGWIGIIFGNIRLWRYFSLTLCLVFLLMISPFFQSAGYRWRVDMLDVGHGLAIVIRQGRSAVLYDTGQRYQESSEAERQIIPFLQWHQLDLIQIILSHEHNDHAGGLAILQKTYPNTSLVSSSSRLSNHLDCRQGVTWQWLSLNFEILWPPNLAQYAVNEHSCVIKVSDGRFSILLTGDLEKAQEQVLAQKMVTTLSTTILQVPHHGSNTSSSYAFLSKVKPDLAINSVARYNPWHLPSPKTIGRYNDLAIPIYSTHQQGQVSFYFFADQWQVVSFRQRIKPRWYHDWFGSLHK